MVHSGKLFLVFALALAALTPGHAYADVVVSNLTLDDYVTPFVLPAEETALGIGLKNPTEAPARLRITLPIAIFDEDGNALSPSETPGNLVLRVLTDPEGRFNYDALAGAPLPEEQDISLPLPGITPTLLALDGSLAYGYATFTIPDLVLNPGEEIFAALNFAPGPNTLAAALFLNQGMDPANTGYLLPNVETAWLASPDYTGDLLDTEIFGPNRVLMMAYETVPVPEPGIGLVALVALGASAAKRQRRSRP